jgi:hypothetical protein
LFDSKNSRSAHVPHILIAGVVESLPNAQPFPAQGRPRTDVKIRSEDSGRATLFLVRGFDEQADELGLLAIGDAVAIAGKLEIESKDGKVGILVIANQTMPIVRRSRNRFGGGTLAAAYGRSHA